MLEHLRIRNLALLEGVELAFGPGFVAVTGETGAGKSVLLGGLSLLSGARADKSIIRQGAEQCEVEGILYLEDCERIDRALREMGLPECEEGSLVLTRSVAQGRGSRVSINGQLTTVANLQTLGEFWIDFHGPGEPQKLFHERWQLELVDLFGRNGDLLDPYEKAYTRWRGLLAEMERVRGSAQLSEDEAEFLQSQIELIDGAALSEENVEQLERDYQRLSGAQELTEGVQAITEVLQGETSVLEQLGSVLSVARGLTQIDGEARVLGDRLESIIIEVEDLGSAYAGLLEEADLDEESAQALEERMDQWQTLKRKYGGTVASVLKRREEMFARLQSQGDIEGTLLRLEREAKGLERELKELASALRSRRLKAAHALSREGGALINELGFKKAQLEIEIVSEDRLKEYGDSRVRILFSPNPGQAPLALNKIASSGEIARVMLALKTVLAKVDATPVLVFDEVDANVGGEIARTVGLKLAELGAEGHQVFCITHLPQVASTAKQHFVVRKEQSDDATWVEIGSIGADEEARLVELTRMLGDRDSRSGREHAAALLAGMKNG